MPDYYIRLWNSMNKSGFVPNIEMGVLRILNSSDETTFLLIIEYSKAKYTESKNCDLMTVGKPFAQTEYAFGFPRESALQSKFSDM